MSRDLLFTTLYFLAAVIEIAAALSETRWLVYIFKPSLLILLWLWAVTTPDARHAKGKKLLQAGMLFACMGDIFLMLKGYFLHGLGSFLVMQVLYIMAFVPEAGGAAPRSGWLYRGIPLLFLLAAIVSVVVPRLDDTVLRISVVAYSMTITAMVWFAFLRKEQVSRSSFIFVAAGALVFMVSDALIAVNTFVKPVPHHHLWIMSTYVLAQYGIVRGMLKVG